MKTLQSFLAVAFVAACLSCSASSGKKFDSAKVAEIQDKTTTRAQLEEWFGPPYQRTTMSNTPNGATLRLTWAYAHSSGGGSSTGSKALVCDLNDQGVVVEHAYSEQGKPLK